MILIIAFYVQMQDAYPTDLRAARGAAHIGPVLFVIHVIGRPAELLGARATHLG